MPKRETLPFWNASFTKLMLNFTWWVNRKDAQGRNIFQGGFLGLDNIGVFDRSAPLPTGGFINQADGTSWMAMYSLNLMRIALELAQYNNVYEDIATKFFEHFIHIAEAMNDIGEAGIGLWDEEDKFYYDVLNLPDGSTMPLKVRSMVGLIPLFAVEVLEPESLAKAPEFARHLKWFLNHRPDLARLVSKWQEPGRGERQLLSLLRGHRMKCLLRRMLHEHDVLLIHPRKRFGECRKNQGKINNHLIRICGSSRLAAFVSAMNALARIYTLRTSRYSFESREISGLVRSLPLVLGSLGLAPLIPLVGWRCICNPSYTWFKGE
jgi:hypothetical protein